MPASASTRDDLREYGLHSGDRMSRLEFHRIYMSTPAHFKAELVGGVVYVPSLLKIEHGKNHLLLGGLFVAYEAWTPGVEVGDNTTILLGEEGEPQPDLYMRILPDFGGQSKTSSDDYVQGAPELLAEIALSSRSIDLHAKRDDYARYGVREYLVLELEERKLRWFDLHHDRELAPDSGGICRMESFPGFWIDASALVRRDYKCLMRTFEEGVASAEHSNFVVQLAAKQRKARKRK